MSNIVTCSMPDDFLEKVRVKGATIAFYFKFGPDQGIDKIKLDIVDYILSPEIKEYGRLNSRLIGEALYNGLAGGGFTLNTVTIELLSNMIFDAGSGRNIDIKRFINIDNGLKNTDEVNKAAEASTQFLRTAYGEAEEVRRLAEIKANTSLFDAFFINRGSISSIARGVVSSSYELNRNIKAYLQELLDTIINYLQDLELTSDELQLIKDFVLYDSKGINPNIYQLYNTIKRFLNPNKFVPSDLRQLLADYNNSDGKSKKKLDAYNAFVIFDHFDSYIEITFGKAIDINPNEFGKKTGSNNKYSISDHTAELSKTWRTSDNFDISKEVSSIIKIMLDTTPMYNWGEDTPVSSKYMNFQFYSNLIGKIKSLGVDERAYNIVFDSSIVNEKFWKSLPEDTKLILKNKRLSTVINSIRKNPRSTLHHIFTLLSNNDFYVKYKESLYKNIFSKEELKHIYTVHKAITLNSGLSIRSLVGFDPIIDYYSFLTGVSDSIFKNQFIQYRRDENGLLNTVLLTEHTKNRYSFRVRNAINGRRNAMSKEKYLESVKDLNISNDEEVFRMDVPGTKLSIEVDPFSEGEKVTILVNNKPTSALKRYIDGSNPNVKKSVIQFVDRALGIGIERKSDWLDLFIEQCSDYNVAAIDLLTIAARVLTNNHIANTIFRDFSKKEVEDFLKDYNTKITFNGSVGRINILTKNPSNNEIVDKIGTVNYIRDGLATSTIVKDSQQAALNLQTSSRLLGSYPSQWDLLELPENSATKNLTLINTPGLLLNHYTSSEYYDRLTLQNKEITLFTVGELQYSLFMSDFIPAIFSNNVHSFIGNGKASFLASVNSDKGTIGLLLFNLNKTVKVPVKSGYENVPIKDLTPEQIRWITSKEFSEVYLNIANDILTTLNKVHTLIEEHIQEKIRNDRSLAKLGLNLEVPELNYCHNFSEFNSWYENLILSPFAGKMMDMFDNTDIISLILKLVNKHNLEYPNDLIVLVDNMHILSLKSNNKDLLGNSIKLLANNNVIISLLARFAPVSSRKLGINVNNYYTYDEFFRLKHFELLDTLVRSKTVYNLDEEDPIHANVKLALSDWVNDSNTLGLARIYYNGLLYNIYTSKDMHKLNQDIRNNEKGKKLSDILEDKLPDGSYKVKIELNPIILKHNSLDYWLTLSWMLSTVGTFAAHPYGKTKFKPTDGVKRRAMKQEASCYLALHKRNVSFTALMWEFLLGLLNGTPDTYNIAIIDDIKDYLTILLDNNVEVKPFDGATFVNPFTCYLENNSLGSAAAGIDKKPFVHFKLPGIATAGIIKTAGFAVTNDRIRRSPSGWGILMRKMTDKQWRDLFGNITTYNVLKDWKERTVEYEPTYFAKNGELFKAEISFNEGLYNRRIWLCLSDGSVIRELTPEELDSRGIAHTNIEVNTNYQLWQLFGGEYSLEIHNKRLQPSEASIRNVVKAINSVGERMYKTNGVLYNIQEVETQDLLYQPLKHSDIHYMPTKGAVKLGGGNINSNESVYNRDQNVQTFNLDSDLGYMQIKMYQAGVLLDKEHNADDAELSLPTLIVSACSSLGYTVDIANELYLGLANAAQLGIKTLFDSFEKYRAGNNEALDNLKENVLKLVAKELASGSREENFAKLIALKIIQAVLDDPNNTYLNEGFPISDNVIFNQVLSTISSYINKSSIKMKVPGLLAVLSPSYGLYKLFNDRTWDSLYNWSELDRALVETYKANLSNEELAIFTQLPLQNQLLTALQQSKTPLFDITLEINDSESNLHTLYYNEFIDNAIESENYESDDSIASIAQSKGLTEQDFILQVRKEAIESIGEVSWINRGLSKLRLGRFYNLTLVDGSIESRFIGDPNSYYELKLQINRKEVLKVIEDTTKGRDLGAYNAIFKTLTGEEFLLWDLDSLRKVHELVQIALSKDPNVFKSWQQRNGVTSDIKTALKEAHKQVSKDLERISPHVIHKGNLLELKFREFLNLANKQEFKDVLEEIDSKIDEIVRFILGCISSNDIDTFIASSGSIIDAMHNNPSSVLSYFKNILDTDEMISIDGKLYTVNKSSVQEEAYELIMPKVFLNEFGFDEFTDLNEVKNNPNWFTEKIISNLNTKLVNDNSYDVVLKRLDGNHLYILTKDHLLNSELVPSINEIITEELEDGTIVRKDRSDNVMYKMLSGSKIYQTVDGEEVIVVDNYKDIEYYINNVDFDVFDISQARGELDGKFVEDLIDLLEDNTGKIGEFIRTNIIWDEETLDTLDIIESENILQKFREVYNNLTLENYKNLGENHPIIKAGRRKYTSFLKSLDVVAARIPAQSLQSFMPMKVVAYENPNRNSAYVSVLQLLLQGSDLDIDAVSIVTFDIDSNGLLLTWSPYSNLDNIKGLELSLRLPYPTGKEIDVVPLPNATYDCILFFEKYKNLFNIVRPIKGKYAGLLKVFLNRSNTGLRDLLSEKSLTYPETLTEVQEVLTKLKKDYPLAKLKITEESDLRTIYNQIKEIIDKHNLFFNKLDLHKLRRALNNYITQSLFTVSKDIANQMQAQSPVDATTKKPKDAAEYSDLSELSETRTPGNSANKCESIEDNQVGKDCIAICAVGLKGFFALTEYINIILNEKPEELRFLVGKVQLGKGVNANKARKAIQDALKILADALSDFNVILANVRAKDISTVTNGEVLALLLTARTVDDAALVLSALLSLSTDRQ